MIKGYTRNNLWDEVLALFCQMKQGAINTDKFTSPLVILLIRNYIPNPLVGCLAESYNFFHFASTTLELHNFTFCTFSLMQELEIDYRNRP
jgi:hypothetical protein